MSDVHLCGWRVRSALPLPALATWRGAADHPVDLVILLGPVPASLAGAAEVTPSISVTSDGTTLLDILAVGRFLIRGGASITADLIVAPDDGALQTTVLGIVLGIVCYQRGLLPLHASAVMVGNAAIAFAGRSGIGKSTVAAAFARRGYPVLSDDVVPVVHREGRTILLPASRHLRLWNDTLTTLSVAEAGLVRSRPDGLPKFHVPVEADAPVGAVPLAVLVHLLLAAGGNRPGLLHQTEAFRLQTISRCVYRGRLASRYARSSSGSMGGPTSLPEVAVYQLRAERGLERLDQTIDALEALVTGGRLDPALGP